MMTAGKLYFIEDLVFRGGSKIDGSALEFYV